MKSSYRLNAVVYLVPIVLFFALMLCFSWLTYADKVKNTVEGTKLESHSLRSLTAKMEKVLQENFHGKYSFVDMAGATAKALQLNSFNSVEKLADGSIAVIPG
ncbi:MAG: hypothetical protein LUC43_03720, partial [Burkholderiales bacterium]|nr:hypothetical protein [Burkholderiales bacterium]